MLSLTVLLLPLLAAGHVIQPSPSSQIARPASAPHSAIILPTATPSVLFGSDYNGYEVQELELRQVADVVPVDDTVPPKVPENGAIPGGQAVPPANPNLNPGQDPGVKFDPNAPAAPPIAPVAPAITTIPAAPNGDVLSVTDQWKETVDANGVKTWMQVFITFTFKAVPSQLPSAGKGAIGMGTIKGATGVTKTVGAANSGSPSRVTEWMAAFVLGAVGAVGLL